MIEDITTYILRKRDISINIKVPIFYENPKLETQLAYALLYYMYYEKYKINAHICDIQKGANGKPFFAKDKAYFNISHSKNFVACSIADFEVGLDIEEDRKISKRAKEKFLIDGDLQNELKTWNIKEAYSKYLGTGLKLDFKQISIQNILLKSNLITEELKIAGEKVYLSVCYSKFCKNVSHKLQEVELDSLI